MKYIAITSCILLGIGLYLNRSYAHIYTTIGKYHLPNPTVHRQVVIRPESGKTVGNLVYVALGDSLTAGVGASGESMSYPYRLAQKLANKQNSQVTLVNLGVPGATAEDVLRDQVPQAGQLRPDIVSVAVGVNDMHNFVSGKLFAQTMAGIVDQLNSTTKHLNVINIPFIGDKTVFLPPYRLYFDIQTKRYNNFLNTALANRRSNIIDLYGLTHGQAIFGQEYYAADGFHPSDYGYDAWADSLYDYFDY